MQIHCLVCSQEGEKLKKTKPKSKNLIQKRNKILRSFANKFYPLGRGQRPNRIERIKKKTFLLDS